MPTFSQPWWLLALVVVPLLIRWWLRQNRAAVRFSSAGLVTQAGRRGDRARRLGAGLRAVGLTLLIIALAGPRWPDPGTRVPTYGISIAMVLDVSRSMTEEDFQWDKKAITRLEAARRVFRLFVAGGAGPEGERLEGRQSDLVGLIVFATRPDTACPLTLNHDVLLNVLDSQQARVLPGEGTTNQGDAIIWALHRLQQSPTRRKVLILLTDGEHNVPEPALTPRQAGQLAANLGVSIYAIHAGSETAAAEEKESAAEFLKAKKTLQTLAAMTGGRYFHAADTAALVEAAAEIDQLERQEILSLQYRRYYEGFAWFALAALGLWLLVAVLDYTVWRRVP